MVWHFEIQIEIGSNEGGILLRLIRPMCPYLAGGASVPFYKYTDYLAK